MNIEEILSKIESGLISDFCSDSNPIALSVDFTRGPEPLGALTHIKTSLKEVPIDPTLRPHVIFLIDQSGSMEGSNHQAATDVFNTVYDALRENTQVSIILFNDKTFPMQIPLKQGDPVMSVCKSEIDDHQLKKTIAERVSRGGTNIIGALKATAAAISQNPDMKPTKAQIDNTSIIFITDGRDNGYKNYVELSREVGAAERQALPAVPPTSLTSTYTRPPSTLLPHPPHQYDHPVPEVILRLLKQEMQKDYGSEHFARVMPIGIGLDYDERLLMGIGEDSRFHRTGFLHIVNDSEVEGKKSELITTVDPVRMKTALFIVHQDGTHALYPEVYVQRGPAVAKEYFIDSTQVKDIYLIQEYDETRQEITRVRIEPPALEHLPFQEEILRRYFIAESAGLLTRCTKCQDKTLFPELLKSISQLLQHYSIDYWGKDEQCKTALQTLKEHYTRLSDAIAQRPAPQIFTTSGNRSFFNQRDSLLTTISASTRTVSISMTLSSTLPSS